MVEIKISSLGRQGDGIGILDELEVFVPYTLPGEVVEVSGSGKRLDAKAIVTPSSLRHDPLCQHFGICGGCQLQHYDDAAYREWKHKIVTESLKRAGILVEVDPLICFPTGSRRKVVFNANRVNGTLQFGYFEQGGKALVDVAECPILSEELTRVLPAIRDFASSLSLGVKPDRLCVLATPNGIDLDIDGPMKISPAQKNALSQKAMDAGFARLSLNGEILIEPKRPYLEMGLARVTPPPGGFVQAVAGAEAVMADLVCAHLEGCKAVTDLFCGVGTFALRLAEHSTVWAIEENRPSVTALDRAWRETGGKLKQIKAEVRNLDRRPASYQELKKHDGLVFDPPRAGAEIQARQIAKSKVRKVAAVSCNPTTLVRDLAILIDGGYRIKRAIPIDQFRFTPHVEVVVLLER